MHIDCARRWTLPLRCIHDDMFLFVMHGHLFVRVAGREHELDRGDAAHFRRGDWHSAAADPAQRLELISLHYNATVFESLTLPPLLDFPDVFCLGGDQRITTLLREACRIFALQPGWRRGLEAVSGQLLWRLIHDHGDWLTTAPPEARLTDVRRLLPALELIRSAVDDPPTMTRLAQRCGLSESQFRRIFRRTMGVTGSASTPSPHRGRLPVVASDGDDGGRRRDCSGLC